MLNDVECGRPGKGNDKGKVEVEGLVKYTQGLSLRAAERS
jgi:hypothetical protein